MFVTDEDRQNNSACFTQLIGSPPGPRIVEGELKEEGELEPRGQGSIHSRWQRDKGAAENNRRAN